MKPIEKELDRLVQQLRINQRCHICGAKATEIHHIIGRKNYVLRYDLPNLLPVCQQCHSDIHDKGLSVESYVPSEIWQYLQENKNKSYKDFLLFCGMTEDEYFTECRKVLKNAGN